MHKAKITLSRLLVILVVLAVVGIVTVVTVNRLQQNDTTTKASNTTDIKQPVTNDDVITFTASSDGSALAQLEKHNDSVITVESEMGTYVDSINGLAGGTDGKYWSLYIDGEMAPVGADKFMPQGGEDIEWKFQKL